MCVYISIDYVSEIFGVFELNVDMFSGCKYLRAAGVSCCITCPRDDVIVQAAARLLAQAGQKACCKTGPRELQQVRDIHERLLQSRREFHADFDNVRLSSRIFRDSRRDACRGSLPTDLPRYLMKEVLKELQPAVVRPPPVSVPMGRQRNAPPSTQSALLTEWLESKEGKLWRQERDLLFGTRSSRMIDGCSAE